MEIVRLTKQDRKDLVQLYREITLSLSQAGIRQWDRFYPNRFVIEQDLKRGTVYGIRGGQRIIGAVVVDSQQSGKYARLIWNDRTGKPSCIHRLAVHPDYQGQGIGKRLLQFAEEHAREAGSSSIRLDVFTGNPGAVGMYRRAGYVEVGTIKFPMRKVPYLCFEKLL
ncbi:ribosomal protein S18 acetylase RimI-like enzyme [Paenibacillus taihuensis]|uniref:Ribosomal protein S18 acetylase RimI-like enzyme n=1 Tax=Paenibacillus taihuensis TaxID=1156355 RepID=A0A3D9RHB0_9BACL|nr:GNAT family N-acetyltransferase [Paenibacillus taihuensis]REE77721.1 ribosomal protein S18 acetylase RimI-like enzyme [Paenibacillus taihuensis]